MIERIPLSVRFWAKVDVGHTRECWNWIGARNPLGYGKIWIRGKYEGAHRASYEMAYGTIPARMVIDHICHNSSCVNPHHLRAVTTKQNIENRGGVNPNNTSGARGVYWSRKYRKWEVEVKHCGKKYYGGRYSDLEQAAEAARQLRLSLFTHNDLDRRELP